MAEVTKKCSACKKESPKEDFMNLDTLKECKQCISCRERYKRKIDKRKCITCKKKRSTFNYEGETKALYCADCKLPNMIDIKNTKCITCKKKIPTFNYDGETKALYCADCKLPNMIDIKHSKCITCKKKRPNFNYEGETKALYCADCKLPDMIDVKSAKCITCKKKVPVFNNEGETKALYCADCKLPNMINIKSTKCITCKVKEPTFNYEGETKALYCADCKLPDMIDIKSAKCITCKKKVPVFNNEGETKALYCATCKLPDMIDIKTTKCENCKSRASYGIPSYKPTRCTKHKEENMIFKPRKRCIQDNCQELAIYGKGDPNHCEAHKEEDEINLIYRKCIKCSDIELLDKDNLCTLKCSLIQDIYKRRQQVKQHEVTKFLETRLTEKTIDINDEILDNACTKQRPDIGYDCGTHYVFIEVDENQHRYSKGYEAPCEVSRMIKLTLSCGGKGAIFIRYNPDAFRDNNGKVCKVAKAQRQDNLLRWVRHCFTLTPENKQDFLRIIYLYYDAYDQAKEKLISLDLTNYSKEEMIESRIKLDVLNTLLMA